MSDLAVVIIASEKRRTSTFPTVLESVRAAEPDEIAVVADFPCEAKGVRSYMMAPMLFNTIDALVKRDIGTLVTQSPNVCYLCDDHILRPDFVTVFRDRYRDRDWSALAPARYCIKPGEDTPTWLNVGQDLGYIGGHCGIYRRYWVTQVLPWSAGPHNLNWDLHYNHALRQRGMTITYAHQDLAVMDIEPGARPWL
jgi:hypothetical protein